VFVTILAFAANGRAYANFANSFGFSAEGIARGNAMTASVHDWSSVYYNMAGLGRTRNLTGETAATETGGEMTLKLRKTDTQAEGGESRIYANQIAINVLATIPQLKLNIPQRLSKKSYYDSGTSSWREIYYPLETGGAKMKPYGFLMIGGALDLNTLFKMPSFISSARIGLGLGTNWDGKLVRVNDIDPRTHNFLRFGREIQTSVIYVGAGIGFLKDAFGVGGGVNISFIGQASAYMDTLLTGDPQIPITEATMDLALKPTALAGIYFSPGKLWSPLEGLDIGASYRQEAKLKINPFNAVASLLNGAISMSLLLEISDYYTPHTVNSGIAYTRWGVTLSVDVGWEMWSKNYISKVLQNHYFNLPKFNDILVYRAGVKYDIPNIPNKAVDIAIMAGYSFVPSIIAKDAGTAVGIRIGLYNQIAPGMYNYLDNDKHIGSAGIKITVPQMWRLGGQIVISLGYQYQYLVPKSVKKTGIVQYFSLPGQPTPPSSPSLLEGYFLNPSYSYGGMNHGAVIEVGMRI